MASSTLPDKVLLEDANDVVDFLEYAGRIPRREEWCEEIKWEIAHERNEGLF